MLLNSNCAGCHRVGPVLCRACRFALLAPPNMPRSSEVVAAVPFAGRPRDVLLGFKYGNRRQLAHHFAGLLVNRLVQSGVDGTGFDVVTWAPTSRAHRQRRGFDQAEVVAKRVAAQLGLPCRRLLERDRASVAQTGLARIERLHGPVFRASPSVRGKRVLVIDDVVTTGSTLRSAAAALREGGATAVQRAAVATTPAIPARRRPAAPVARRGADALNVSALRPRAA
ncbi:MAG TPA: phosphoribosyltransferase family protein [Ilumatobacter sp.]|nr:phosphoribosyltransferase family protein [Ilumatobacter sp.]